MLDNSISPIETISATNELLILHCFTIHYLTHSLFTIHYFTHSLHPASILAASAVTVTTPSMLAWIRAPSLPCCGTASRSPTRTRSPHLTTGTAGSPACCLSGKLTLLGAK